MNLECAQCQARYRIDDAVIPPQGARVRCRHCSNIIAVPAPVIELAPSDLELIPPPSLPGRDAVTDTPPSLVDIPALEPAAARTRPEPAPAPVAQEPAAPPPARPSEPVAPVTPAAPTGAASGDSFEHFGLAPSSPPPVSEEFERFTPVLASPGTAPPSLAQAPPMSQSSESPVLAPTVPRSEPDSPALAEPAVARKATEPESAQATSNAPAGAVPLATATAGTPIPEGLSPEDRVKHEKARRLARVLASDIAIYNREKKDQGAREGNLVAVLGYEIKKSWEVYKERVGADFANSTPYFRDALNDMLAEGKKIF